MEQLTALILAAGKGTRMESELPKVLHKCAGKPMVRHVIEAAKAAGAERIVVIAGYKSEEVRNFFGDSFYFGVEVSYAVENEPLGTGGAIRNCIDKMKYDYALVINGDTLFEADLKKLEENFLALNADMSIACKANEDKSRYGTIKIDRSGEKTNGDKTHGIVVNFDEKAENDEGDKENKYINGGIYVLKKSLIETIPENQNISLEKELIPKWLEEGKLIGAVVSGADFIDIGTPESLDEFNKSKKSEKEE
jgi:NDP-sugar pyrophosphorylase family protein